MRLALYIPYSVPSLNLNLSSFLHLQLFLEVDYNLLEFHIVTLSRIVDHHITVLFIFRLIGVVMTNSDHAALLLHRRGVVLHYTAEMYLNASVPIHLYTILPVHY